MLVLGAAPVGLIAATPTDREIEESAKSTYNFRRVLDRNVEVKVNQGVATLTGTVATDEQRRLAEDTVAGLKGVSRVDNQVKVQGHREGSDDWIALKVRTRLAIRPNVSMTNTNVNVKDGVVTLTGIAESMAQKELTTAYAKDVQGVRSVDNKLQVLEPTGRAAATPTTRTGVEPQVERRETIGEKIDDASITAQIKYELLSHRSTSALKTKVDTDAGRVVITGEAQTDAERDLVTKLAKETRGVMSVDNRMTVKTR